MTCKHAAPGQAGRPGHRLATCLRVSPAGNPQIWRGFCCHTKLLCIKRRVECSEATSAAPSFCCQCLCPLSSVLSPQSCVLCIFVFVSALDCKCDGGCCCVFFNFLHNFHFILVRFLTARRRCYQYLSSSSAALPPLATGFGLGFSCFCPFATEAAKCFCNNIFPEISYHLSGLTTNLSF